MSAVKRTLRQAEERMATKKAGLFAMPPNEIRQGREKLLGRYPEGTPPDEIKRLEDLKRRIWNDV